VLLQSLLEEFGFGDIKVEFGRPIIAGIGEEGIKASQVCMNGLSNMKRGILGYGIISGEEYDSLLSSLQDEWDQGLGADLHVGCVIYAKKL